LNPILLIHKQIEEFLTHKETPL